MSDMLNMVYPLNYVCMGYKNGHSYKRQDENNICNGFVSQGLAVVYDLSWTSFIIFPQFFEDFVVFI